jgi:hypothetical protein
MFQNVERFFRHGLAISKPKHAVTLVVSIGSALPIAITE